MNQKIRIRLKAYDHEIIDQSARKIVDTVTRTGARTAGPVPLPTEKSIYCVIRSPHKDKEMVMPGDNVSITVKLIAPIAMEEGLRFAIREGGRTVGAGVVTSIIE